jgi:hypothetical protein
MSEKLSADFILDIYNTLRREYSQEDIIEFLEPAVFIETEETVEVHYAGCNLVDVFYKIPSITLVHEADC